jgi:putative membrane protein
MKQHGVALAALAAVFLAAGAAAQDKAGVGKPVTDAQFVLLATAADLAEINLGYLAVKRAKSAEVKKFGERMVADHTNSTKELLKIANKKGLPAARQMGARHREAAAQLQQLRGAAFDRAYMKHMVTDHQKAVALYESRAKQGRDEDLKAFAAKTLPVLQEHLKMAQEIAADLKGDGGK